ncbi:MAG: tetratricopeptide repeat protein [Anaerolineaceae bacterium]|nr:tetratricopeptide repeat protein [Anaerolineaceae bacterium]
MNPDFIVDVSDESFEMDVLAFSNQAPVVMDLWAPWSIPCRVQSPLLAKLASEAQGVFRLARVNVEEQAKLAEKLKVKSVPSLKAFLDGRIVADYTGVLTEENLRAFIKRILPDEGSLQLAKGLGLLQLGHYDEAEEALEGFLANHPYDPAGQLALARTLLIQGQAVKAEALLRHFPPSPQFKTAQALIPLVKVWLEAERGNAAASPQEAIFRNALRLARRGNIPAALDGLLDLLRKDRHCRNDEVRDVYLALLLVLGEENPLVRQYRTDLTNVLF